MIFCYSYCFYPPVSEANCVFHITLIKPNFEVRPIQRRISLKSLHFVQTIHMCLLYVFPGLERKISVRTSKEELIQRGILLPAEVRLYFFIIIDYFWLLLILVVAVCYMDYCWSFITLKKAFLLQRRDYTS